MCVCVCAWLSGTLETSDNTGYWGPNGDEGRQGEEKGESPAKRGKKLKEPVRRYRYRSHCAFK